MICCAFLASGPVAAETKSKSTVKKETVKKETKTKKDKTSKTTEEKAKTKAKKASTAKSEARKTININKAGVKELATLEGIGEERAKKIVEYRKKKGPFKKREDLMNISGIGPKIFEKNKVFIKLK